MKAKILAITLLSMMAAAGQASAGNGKSNPPTPEASHSIMKCGGVACEKSFEKEIEEVIGQPEGIPPYQDIYDHAMNGFDHMSDKGLENQHAVDLDDLFPTDPGTGGGVVTSVPEPADYALMLAGLATVGLACRRKKA